MKLGTLSGTFLVAAMWARMALPCDCPPPPPVERSFADASVVAVVRVANVERKMVHTGTSISTGPVHIQLQVTRAWKGAKAGDVIEIVRAEGGSTCDYDLNEGTRHVLYLERREQGRLDARASHCARSRSIDSADEEIRALDKVASPAEAASAGSASPLAPPRKGCAGCIMTDRSATSPGAWLIAVMMLATIAARRSVRRN